MKNIPCKACSYDPSLVVIDTWTFVIPLAVKSGNALRSNGRGYSGHAYRKERDMFLEKIRVLSKGVKPAKNKRRVFFVREYGGKAKPFDSDNLATGFKPVRDCLTELGLLVDDNPKWCEAHYSQLPTGVNQTLITIEDVSWS